MHLQVKEKKDYQSHGTVLTHPNALRCSTLSIASDKEGKEKE
jgi:hypothetical protein